MMIVAWVACTAPRFEFVVGEAIEMVERGNHATIAYANGTPFVMWNGEGNDRVVRVAKLGDDSIVTTLEAPTDVFSRRPDGVAVEGRLHMAYQTSGAGLRLVAVDDEISILADPLVPPESVRGGSVDLAWSGGPHVVWFDAGDDEAFIRGASFDATLAAAPGLPPVLSTIRTPRGIAPDVAAHPDGTLSAAYTIADGRQGELAVDLYASDGARVGAFRYLGSDGLVPRRPTVEVDAEGRSIVVFRETNLDLVSQRARAVVLDPRGEPLHDPRTVFDQGVDRPVIALMDGLALIAVEADGAIEVAAYDVPDLNRVSDRVVVTEANEAAARPHLAVDPTRPGRFALSYEVVVDGGHAVRVRQLVRP